MILKTKVFLFVTIFLMNLKQKNYYQSLIKSKVMFLSSRKQKNELQLSLILFI